MSALYTETLDKIRKSDYWMIRMDEINEAYERTKKSDVRYRFVIDMASLET